MFDCKGIIMNTSVEYIANFKTTLDPYNGLTIQSEDLPQNIFWFWKEFNYFS